MRRFAACLALLLFVGSGSAHGQSWAAKQAREVGLDSLTATLRTTVQEAVGKPASPLTLHALNGDKTETIADFAGRTVLVTFWSTGCSGSKNQLPDLSRLQRRYGDRGLEVIYVAAQKREAVRSYLEDHQISGTKRAASRDKMKRPFQMLATPSTFVIDTKGVVQEGWIGPKPFDQLKKRVEPYLPEK